MSMADRSYSMKTISISLIGCPWAAPIICLTLRFELKISSVKTSSSALWISAATLPF